MKVIVRFIFTKLLLFIGLCVHSVIYAQFALPTFHAFHAKKVFNYVLDLNGSNEAAYVDDDPSFETTDFSIQAWVDPSSLPSTGNQAWFVNKNRVYRMGLDNNGGTTKIIAQHRSGGTYENIEGSTLLDASGGWYHVVFTFDDSSNRLRIYVNGSKINEESYSGSTVNQNSEFSIGRRHDTNGGYYNGKIDEVGYWLSLIHI